MGFSALAAIAVVAGTAYQIEQGEDAAREQRRAMRNQERVQRDRLAQQLRTERENREAQNRAKMDVPDPQALLDAGGPPIDAASGTLLAGTFGLSPANLRLGPPGIR